MGGAVHLYGKYGFEKMDTHDAFLKIGKEKIAIDFMSI